MKTSCIFARVPALREIRAGAADRPEKLAPDVPIEEKEDHGGDDRAQEALTSIEALIPDRDRHFGFPSRRN